MTCEHPDVRYCADEKGAVACFKCGRLFGHLRDAYFIPFNPGIESAALAKGWVTPDEARRSLKDNWPFPEPERAND